MSDEWRLGEVILIYKNKGDIQVFSNYRGVKLLGYTMKLWERVIERRLRMETRVSENQLGFMPRRLTTKAIHLLRSLMKKYRERQRDLHMAFLDLEKAYDSVSQSAKGLDNKLESWKESLEDNGLRCWRITKALADRVEITELRMLRWTCGKTMLDMILNEVFRAILEVEIIIYKMKEGRLRWFGHVKRRLQTTPGRRVKTLLVDGLRRMDRPKLMWEDRLRQNMKELLLSEDVTSNRNAWRDRIRISG
ncbi:retrovirus-related pol polyprotein LINE-1 [Tanacetum coccineum]